MTELVVELYGEAIGHLQGERDRFDFVASPEALGKHGIQSTILSLAIPLTRYPQTRGRNLRRNFFEELLAEGRIRERLSANARLDPDNTMAMLQRYGRDVAGALQIWNPSDVDEPRTPALAPLSDIDVAKMMRDVKVNPLGNTGKRRLSSIAGVQDKILLAQNEAGWGNPLDGYASTHILKPKSAVPSLIFDEEYGSRFARRLGLANFDTRIEYFSGDPALVITRYDRDEAGLRLHQEDFNQALGYRGDGKYESGSGDGRLRRIATSLRAQAGAEDGRKLARMLTLSLAVGNLDMHAKNISILHARDGEVRLAPMYDVVPQLHLEVDRDVALFVNGKRHYDDISGADLVAEVSSWRVRDAQTVIEAALEEIEALAEAETQLAGAHHDLQGQVMRHARRLLDGLSGAAVPPSNITRPARAGETAPKSAPGGWGGPVG